MQKTELAEFIKMTLMRIYQVIQGMQLLEGPMEAYCVDLHDLYQNQHAIERHHLVLHVNK